ncbi:putative merozoite capping protein-1 protein [Botrytis fragariae]|uniref:thioredoxin-dependent peroxiredoxin n=1 Tax=Botrytis fragariae TaxID=1964551 RepID=A0A8H6ALH8_9HELO|nr:putative merozoite capping protein-1 protein [Botrytis fragariae]KAF5869465.1 putative merozoite capping protein-1 protein [Botrytis fragariae]
MPVTLRKRPAPAEPPAPAPPAKKKSTVAKTVAKVKETVKKAAEPKATKATKAAPASKTNGSKAKTETKVEAPAPLPQVKASKASAAAPAPAATTKAVVGETIDLKGFGGEIETNEGEKTTLEKLVSESKNGVVLFTYPKASTPGCTTQVCAFRDSHPTLLLTGYTVYGLSKDSPKSNTTFKTNQKLPYTLLCDTKASLISAIGLKNAKGTTRGVFVIDKSGKVLAAQAGSPKGTLELVEKLIGAEKEETEKEEAAVEGEKETEKENENETAEETKEEVSSISEEKQTEEPTIPETNGTNGTNSSTSKEDVAKAEVAADVADTAEKLDGKDSEVKAAETSTA